MKPALLVIDVQKQFFDISPGTAGSLTEAIEYINAAIALFRKKQFPVIVVQQVNKEDNLVPGNPAFDLPEALKVLPQDIHIHKTYGNAFNKTLLRENLEEEGIDTVIITGFCAEYCILSTYRGAEDIDLAPIILKGSLASVKPEHIRFVEDINEVISFGALEKMLD
ncbi:MAG: cysteine hydrolase [Spirochaetales bacterium]|nr:cysteine hydrolase [Spirochaetales bacterium]